MARNSRCARILACHSNGTGIFPFFFGTFAVVTIDVALRRCLASTPASPMTTGSVPTYRRPTKRRKSLPKQKHFTLSPSWRLLPLSLLLVLSLTFSSVLLFFCLLLLSSSSVYIYLTVIYIQRETTLITPARFAIVVGHLCAAHRSSRAIHMFIKFKD